MITRLIVTNFLQLRHMDVQLEDDANIFVGRNDTGKSSVMLAVEIALNGRFRGRSLENEVSPHWFTKETVTEFLAQVATNPNLEPPRITVEAFFREEAAVAAMKGKNNSLGLNSPGVRLDIHLDPAFAAEYKTYITGSGAIASLPVEFYRIERTDFAGETLAGRRSSVRAVLIDAATLQLQAGMDFYLRRSIRDNLPADARAKLSLAYRQHRDDMLQDAAFTAANAALAGQASTLSNRALSLATDVSGRGSWEAGITPHIDDIPFDLIGQGEQSAFKILLALNKSADAHHVVMVEEPENHLSHSHLNLLLTRVREHLSDQQLLVSTHSSFVLNKLGVKNLRLMMGQKPHVASMNALSDDTLEHFRKLPGYDTLRLILSRAIILVEGPSDELLIQRAYSDTHHGRLPIDDGIDVMSVGLTFKRFLELGAHTSTKIAVITDLDDDASDAKARARFQDFEITGRVQGFIGKVADGRTLENQLVAAAGRDALNRILGTSFTGDDDLAEHMKAGKTDTALALFDSSESIRMPKHINDAIAFVA